MKSITLANCPNITELLGRACFIRKLKPIHAGILFTGVTLRMPNATSLPNQKPQMIKCKCIFKYHTELGKQISQERVKRSNQYF